MRKYKIERYQLTKAVQYKLSRRDGLWSSWEFIGLFETEDDCKKTIIQDREFPKVFVMDGVKDAT